MSDVRTRLSDCPNLSEPEMIQNFEQPKPDSDLNSDMIDCPNFKFGQKFYDRTRFFSAHTNPNNQVEWIFASPTASWRKIGRKSPTY